MKLEVKNMKLHVGFWSGPTMTKIVRWLASSFDPHSMCLARNLQYHIFGKESKKEYTVVTITGSF